MRTSLLVALTLTVLAGCTSGSALEASDPSDNPAATDLTDALLTERSPTCAEHAAAYFARATDVGEGVTYTANVSVTTDGTTCTIASNAIPNHDFNATGHFATPVSEQDQAYTVVATPAFAAAPTPISLDYDDAVFLNGVNLDLLAAGCYGVGNGHIGCHDLGTPYRYDPMGTQTFGADEHHAHTQPDGTYHYHGNPKALFDETDSGVPSPVIGFAADGFPIFGSYFDDGTTVRKAQSSYQLKTGTRDGGPGGAYDGTFVDDWAYTEGAGDLDACNGMTVDGVYGYYVTDAYPHVIGCFMGTPHASFRKGGF
ncbi:MAG: YHYH protein [Bacteroidota bacterium]